MNYNDALKFVHSIPKFRRPFGNANLRRLLECLGVPQERLKFIHIAGTNGKGSTAAMVAAALKAQGYKTGLFTSPYIEVFNERIQINNVNISDETLSEYIWFVKDTMEKSDAPVSEFAFITAVALTYFENAKCDLVVLETGMGGRYDATNVIDESVVSVITSIGLDHTQYLGNTIEAITREKCGIIKEYGTVISYPNTNVMPIIEAECMKNHASLTVAASVEPVDGGLVYKERYYPLALRGEYQLMNAAVALETLSAVSKNGFEVSLDAVRKGFMEVKWPARFEFMRDNVIIDGGHNLDGIRALKKSLRSLYKNVVLVMAMMEDKAYEECIREIAPNIRKLIATELDMQRSVKAEKLAEAARGINADIVVENNAERAFVRALKEAKDEEIICVCGSLYLAGEAKKFFSKNILQNE
ncbi:MAG: bifunctional folylpolyglutamate synthase/dihydrofolate synthase [Oscillospiraceae bacterium]|nr:bifunctional folylpolyglutamate synthase/dihydrofolate synthase [Oscillospiraceae bacterium]